jgi:TolA-binding protein
MKSRNGIFLTACLSITALLLLVYSQFVSYFGENSDHKVLAETYARELRQEKFKRALAESRLQDFSQEVASVLPADSQKNLAKNGYNVRSFASVVRSPAAVNLDLSGVVFERAKKSFSEKKYPEAMKEFRRLIEDYPLSPHKIEAHFLLGEAAFLSGDPKACMDVADTMVTQFPEHELTGFILIRLGQINEISNRAEEAAEIYRTVIKNFKNPVLKEQAVRMAKALDSE